MISAGSLAKWLEGNTKLSSVDLPQRLSNHKDSSRYNIYDHHHQFVLASLCIYLAWEDKENSLYFQDKLQFVCLFVFFFYRTFNKQTVVSLWYKKYTVFTILTNWNSALRFSSYDYNDFSSTWNTIQLAEVRKQTANEHKEFVINLNLNLF